MIDLYFYPSPNTWKASIMLEECGLPYRVILIDITKDEQFAPEFLAISPNNRVPAIVDHDAPDGPLSIFESGAILLHLAEKTGRFLAHSGAERAAAFEWLMWQMGGLGPMAGQAHHFRRYKAAGNDYAITRYTSEMMRLYNVLDRRLADRAWLAGDYSIADISCWGWVWFHRLHGQDLADFSNVKRWFFEMSERPAVQRGKAIGLEASTPEFAEVLSHAFYDAPDSFESNYTQVR